MSVRFRAAISGSSVSGFGRLLAHVPLQTCHWGDIARVRRPTCQVDPQRALANVRYRAVNPDTANYPTEQG